MRANLTDDDVLAYNKFCDRLRILRAKEKITRKVLSEATGISMTQLGYIENWETYISLIYASKLANFYNVSLDFLLNASNADFEKFVRDRYENNDNVQAS